MIMRIFYVDQSVYSIHSAIPYRYFFFIFFFRLFDVRSRFPTEN